MVNWDGPFDLDMRRKARLAVTGIVVVSLFLALFARLFYLQVIDGAELASAAEANQVRTVYEEAPRGRIVDRNGKVLAASREADAITVDREMLVKHPDLLRRLAPVLQTTEEALRNRFNDSRNSTFGPAVVASEVDKGIVATFRERQGEFPGVEAQTLVERWYPNGQLAAHVLGYVGEINEDELKARQDDGYRLGDNLGKTGLEAAYEKQLRGKPGVSKVEVDSQGRAVRVLDRKVPTPGNDIQLSLDIDVQRAAEQGLSEAADAVRARTQNSQSARGGAAVALDPRDGSVIAMASYPAYDPAAFAGGISTSLYQELTDPNGARPLNNRAIQGTYAPGSTFKLVTSIAGLQKNVITPQTVVQDGGAFYLGGQRFQNAQGKAYGAVSLEYAMTVSSDVFFYKLGADLWATRNKNGNAIQDVAANLGLGQKQGFALPGEAEGRIPTPENRKKMHEQMPDVFPEGNWYAGDNVNLAIGQQDTLLTPLQLANAYAGFAKNGTLYVPRLVTKVIDPDGKVMEEPKPEVLMRHDIPGSIKDPIERGLVGAVANSRGTAHSAFKNLDLSVFSVAGKTGTAQVNGKGDTALFAAYAPVNDPRVALSVVVEQGGFGSESAAPIGAKIMGVVSGQAQSTGPVQLQEALD